MPKKKKSTNIEIEKIDPFKEDKQLLEELESMRKEISHSSLSKKELELNIQKINELKARVERIIERKKDLISKEVPNETLS